MKKRVAVGQTTRKAVLFDMDGTLLDSLEDLADCMNAALVAQGLPARPVRQHKLIIGEGVGKYVLGAMPDDKRHDAELIRRVLQENLRLYRRGSVVKTHLYDGVGEMLTALIRRGLRLSLLSNKDDGFVCRIADRFLAGYPFEILRGAVDGVPLKPDPTSALAIAEQMGVPPRQFVYVGDSGTDMKTARAAGMFAVGVLWGFRSREELNAGGAQALIDRPTQLLDLV